MNQSIELISNFTQTKTSNVTLNTSRLNYGALLQYTGLSHGQFILIVIVGFLISSFVYLLYKLGIFTRIKFKFGILPAETTLIYTSYTGSYDKISPAFGQTMEDIDRVFKFSDCFGMYYDNPKQIQNEDESRAVLGCVVNEMEKHEKVKLFLEKFPNYRCKVIKPQTQYLGTKYPFFNSLSILMVIIRVYPRLAQEVKKLKIQDKIGIMQIYKTYDKWQHVQILLPLNNLQHFKLWYPTEKQQTVQNKKDK